MKRCKIQSCDLPYYSTEFCKKHYDKNRRHGDPLFEREIKKSQVCIVPNCTRTKWAKEMCATHYRKIERTGTLEYERLHDGKARERNRARTSKWKKDNWESYKAYLALRKKRVKQATPRWADLNAIREFYLKCPEGYHVDHIIPLNGENISGLHCIDNLQYLPAIENLKKGNKY